MDTRQKILSREGLHAVLAEHRREQRKVVFANGVFDLLHAGHVRYLQAARGEGDLLVVAINSDSSTRRLKGPGRPVLTERARAALVASLACVDYVLIFDESDASGVLREFEPEVHAKGTDYSLGTLPAPEREAAAGLGIRVAIVGDPKDHSTRELLSRLRSGKNG